jgi:hypothetical protein
MREIRTSGLMSGEGKRVVKAIPRPSSTLLPLIRLICVRLFFTLECLLNRDTEIGDTPLLRAMRSDPARSESKQVFNTDYTD